MYWQFELKLITFANKYVHLLQKMQFLIGQPNCVKKLVHKLSIILIYFHYEKIYLQMIQKISKNCKSRFPFFLDEAAVKQTKEAFGNIITKLYSTFEERAEIITRISTNICTCTFKYSLVKPLKICSKGLDQCTFHTNWTQSLSWNGLLVTVISGMLKKIRNTVVR